MLIYRSCVLCRYSIYRYRYLYWYVDILIYFYDIIFVIINITLSDIVIWYISIDVLEKVATFLLKKVPNAMVKFGIEQKFQFKIGIQRNSKTLELKFSKMLKTK